MRRPVLHASRRDMVVDVEDEREPAGVGGVPDALHGRLRRPRSRFLP